MGCYSLHRDLVRVVAAGIVHLEVGIVQEVAVDQAGVCYTEMAVLVACLCREVPDQDMEGVVDQAEACHKEKAAQVVWHKAGAAVQAALYSEEGVVDREVGTGLEDTGLES